MKLNHLPTATPQRVGGQPPPTSTLQSHTPASKRPQNPSRKAWGHHCRKHMQRARRRFPEATHQARGELGLQRVSRHRRQRCSESGTASGWIRPHVRRGCWPKPVPMVPTLRKNWGFTLRPGEAARVLSVARTGPGFKNHCKGEIPKPDQLPFSQHVLRHPRT